MHFFLGVSAAVLNFIFVLARPDNSYSLDSLDSLDSLEPSLNDPGSNNLFGDSSELDEFPSDYTVDPLNQDFTMDSWDSASLPKCETQSSLTDDFLQARDETSCPTKKPEGNLDFPTGLFQDPLQVLGDGLKTPPVGQQGQPDSGSEDGDLNFNAFINNRPKAAITYSEDQNICPPEIYGLSTTPVCHYPNRRMSAAGGQEGGFTLFDVSPCRCFIAGFV